MYCPMSFVDPDFDPEKCLEANCAWWNEHFGMCCQAVDAYLKGQEDLRKERKFIRKEG